MTTFFRWTLAAALSLSLCSPGLAADLYRWTDENGNLHFSDSVQNVPEKHRSQVEKKAYTEEAPSFPAAQAGTQQVVRPADREGRGEKSLRRFEVPYRPYEGSAKRVIVPVVFNNSVTVPVAIDTGAPETVISTRLAERLGLFNEDQGRLAVRAGGIGGSAPAIRSIIDTVQVGGAKSEFVPVTVIGSISPAFEGLLGLDFVSNYDVTIDSKRNVVVFEELPADPGHPGGHDRQWWTSHFMEFADSRAGWKAYSEALERKIHDSMRSIGNDDIKRKAFADHQAREAEKLLDRLDRYASRHSVPTEWRKY